MTKRILLAAIFSLINTVFLIAQVNHTHWKFSTSKITDCEYDLIFTVTIDKGWHTFSINKIKDTDGEVFPTQIIFMSNKAYSLIGNLLETKPTAEYDKTINKTVMLHYNKVVYTQRIKLNADTKTKISGTYQNQVCSDDRCDTPPNDKFNFDLTGTKTCLK